jgi:hypothetical protein
MATIRIEFETDNAAFEDTGEIPAILRRIRGLFQDSRADDLVGTTHAVRDSNGNTVGRVTIDA